ncbi:MAG TPA: hypothetical protein ENG87_04595 [Candidatus Pacearchaeota archaeon]|nr:hypothetical protein BMS3Abin17_00830 [archaeon BMS3Abin17]HDK42635.1 hypothetical protein [Candidatus Pacearchaeota archaeon]HDZ60077.1 hypothetical protein [Candidatus Pacearchaeota archaeon]
MVKEEILFKKGVRVQGLNRIAIPKELLENLEMEEGDKIVIYYNAKNSSINIKKEKEKKDE